MPDLILNELSFQSWDNSQTHDSYPCHNKHQARELMALFVQTLREAGRFPSIPRQIRMREGDLDCALTEGYSILQWRNDPEVDRDARLLLRQRAAVLYYLPDTPQTAVERSGLADVRFGGRKGHGLCAASLLNGIALSFPAHQTWACDTLFVEVEELTSAAEVRQYTSALPHVSQPEHVSVHISQNVEPLIRNGTDLLRQAAMLFPWVEIGPDAQSQISALTGGERYFSWVIRCLRVANKEIQLWQAGPFSTSASSRTRNCRERARSVVRPPHGASPIPPHYQ